MESARKKATYMACTPEADDMAPLHVVYDAPLHVVYDMLRPLFADQASSSAASPPQCAAPESGWKDVLRTAVEFQEEFAANIPTCVCAVCACLRGKADVAFKDIKHTELLLADGPKAPLTPRSAHTTVEFDGVWYCMHPEGVSEAGVCLCRECERALKGNRLPQGSLVRFDAGIAPAALPPLNFVEELIVAPLRVCRFTMLFKPPGAPAWRGDDTFSRGLRGHVVAFPNPPLQDLADIVLPLAPDRLPEFLQVVLLAPVESQQQAAAAASRAKALRVRGPVIAAWVRHLLGVYTALFPDLVVRVDEAALAAYGSLEAVPVALLNNIQVSASEAEANSALHTLAEQRAGYAKARVLDDADADAAAGDCADEGVMAGLDDAEIALQEDASVPVAASTLAAGGVLVSTTAGGPPHSDYLASWFVLTHPQAFPWGTGQKPPGVGRRRWIQYFLRRAPRAQHAHPMLVLDMFDVLQRHEVNAHTRNGIFATRGQLAEFGRMTGDELEVAMNLFASNKRGAAYAQDLNAASPQVRNAARALKSTGAKIEGTAAAAGTIRSKAIALWHAFGPFTAFNTFNPSEMYSRAVMEMSGVRYRCNVPPFGAPEPAAPSVVERWRLVAANPVPCAEFFNTFMRTVHSVLYGWDVATGTQANPACVFGRIRAFYMRPECSGRAALHGHEQIVQADMQPARLRELQASKLHELIEWIALMAARHLPSPWYAVGSALGVVAAPNARQTTAFEDGYKASEHEFPAAAVLTALNAGVLAERDAESLVNEFVACAASGVQLHEHSARCRKGGHEGTDEDCAMGMPAVLQEATRLLGTSGTMVPRCDNGKLVPFTPPVMLAHPCNHMVVLTCDASRYCTQVRGAEATRSAPLLKSLEEAAADAAEYTCKYTCKAPQDATSTASVLFAARNTRAVSSLDVALCADDTEKRDAQQGKKLMARMINSLRSASVFPLAMAASLLLGYKDATFSHPTAPYNPYAFVARLCERQSSCAADDLREERVPLYAVRDGNIVQFTNIATDYECRASELDAVAPYFYVACCERVPIAARQTDPASDEDDEKGDADDAVAAVSHPVSHRRIRVALLPPHTQADKPCIQLRAHAYLPQATANMRAEPAADAPQQEKDQYGLFALGLFASDRSAYVQDAIAGKISWWAAFEAWKCSTAELDVMARAVLRNVDSHAQARVRSAAQARARIAAQQAERADALLGQTVPGVVDMDVDDDDCDEVMSAEFDCVAADDNVGDGGLDVLEQVDGDALLHALTGMDDDMSSPAAKFKAHALRGAPPLDFGPLARQRACDHVHVADFVMSKAAQDRIVKDASDAHANARIDALQNAPRQWLTLQHDGAAPARAMLHVLQPGAAELVLHVHGPPPFVKLMHPPSVRDVIQLFTLSAEQAFAFLLLAKTTDVADLQQRLMVTTGEPGTGKSQALLAFEWYTYKLDRHRRVLVGAYTWRAALNVSNDVFPPWSTCKAFAIGRGGAPALRLPRDSPLYGVSVFCNDEYSFSNARHMWTMSGQAAKATGARSEVFGGMHVALFGDPCQHAPPSGAALYSWCDSARVREWLATQQQPSHDANACTNAEAATAASLAARTRASVFKGTGAPSQDTLGSAMYQEDFSTLVVLKQQQRTPCPLLYKYSRMFASRVPVDRALVEEFCDALNRKVVPLESIAGDVVRTVVLRNEVRAALNWHLASRHAQRLGVRPIAWRAVDTVTSVGLSAEERKTVLRASKLLPAKKSADVGASHVFFEGCMYVFIDNNAPTLGWAKNAACIGQGVLLHPDEPADPRDGPVWWLAKPPLAVFVRPLDQTVSPAAHEVLSAQYPTLPQGIAVPSCNVSFATTFACVRDGTPADIKVTIKRHSVPLGDGYAVTDYYCQGPNFKLDPWLSHVNPPPTGPLLRPSLFVVSSRYRQWDDVKLLAPLWVEGEPGWQQQREAVITCFHNATVMSASLRKDLERLDAAANRTKQQHARLWQQAQEWAVQRPAEELHCTCCSGAAV